MQNKVFTHNINLESISSVVGSNPASAWMSVMSWQVAISGTGAERSSTVCVCVCMCVCVFVYVFDPLHQLCVCWRGEDKNERKPYNQLTIPWSVNHICWPRNSRCRTRCGRDNSVLIIPKNNSFRNHQRALLPKYHPAVSTATTTTITIFQDVLYRTSTSVLQLMTGKVHIKQATKAKGRTIWICERPYCCLNRTYRLTPHLQCLLVVFSVGK
jgi:hypothetical protein